MKTSKIILILIAFPFIGFAQQESNFDKLKGIWYNEYNENLFVCYYDSVEYTINIEYDETKVFSEKISFTENYDFSKRVVESKSVHGDFIVYGDKYSRIMKLTFDPIEQDKFQLFRPWPNENLFYCRMINPPLNIFIAFSQAGCLVD